MAETGGGRDERRAALIRWEGAWRGFKWRTCLALVLSAHVKWVQQPRWWGGCGGSAATILSEQLTFIDSQIGEGAHKKKVLFDAGGLSSDLWNLCWYYKGLRVKDYDDGDGENQQAAPWMLQSDIVYHQHSLFFLFVWPSVCLFTATVHSLFSKPLHLFFFFHFHFLLERPHTVKCQRGLTFASNAAVWRIYKIYLFR